MVKIESLQQAKALYKHQVTLVWMKQGHLQNVAITLANLIFWKYQGIGVQKRKNKVFEF